MSRLLGLQTIRRNLNKDTLLREITSLFSAQFSIETSLLNISLKSIEMARYRLRKKLEIEHEQNLTAFLMSI